MTSRGKAGNFYLVFCGANRSQSKKTTGEKAPGLPLHWSYFILPAAICLLSLILAGYFYRQLPAEVACHFEPDGTPDRWLSREVTIAWALGPQFLFALLGGAIVWGTTRLSTLFRQTEPARAKPQTALLFIGNIIALPQLIVCFAMVDIFSYNLYQTHLLPMWIFLLIIFGLATIGLGLLFALIISRARRQPIPPED